ncbi:VTT domain-containing protein [Pseudomonadales bacterium]|nr:VTT domain-containing protein [Pseudomonadales bacterium]
MGKSGHAVVIEAIVAGLDGSSPLLLLLITLLAFLECLVGIGLFVSGTILLSTATWLYGTNAFPAATIVVAAFIGAIVGDHVGYFVGRSAEPLIFDSKFVKKHQSMVDRINAGLQRSFLIAICVGRLFPVARSLTPAMAGAAGLSRIRFHLFDVIACTAWAGGLALLIIGLGDLLLSYM